MILENFSFTDDLIGVQVNEQYLDLHNNYDFDSCVRTASTVVLKWAITQGHWVSEVAPKILEITIEGVTYFVRRGEFTAVTEFDELGFFETSGSGRVRYNGSNKPASKAALLLFRFVSGAEIAVIGKSASCALTF